MSMRHLPSGRSSTTRQSKQLALEALEPRTLMAADMVLTWNDIMLDAVRVDRTSPPVASRSMAIVHAAIYDAVNAIDRTHAPYAVDVLASPIASREAAVAAAAHATLTSLFPAQTATFDAELEAALDAIADGAAEDAGVALGIDVATQMLALRETDGADGSSTYAPGGEPGEWRPTLPLFASGLLPHWGGVVPFAAGSEAHFPVGGIPALDSAEYAAALNEVQEMGSATSASRTADQTAIALFWANGGGTATPPGHLNMLAHVVAEAEGNTLSENARLFAMLNVAMADAAILCWDVKFDTDFWRPITAIREADSDGNDDTTADPVWTPLISTPPFPTYVSGHSSFSGAATGVLQAFFGGDDFAFTLESENPLIGDRSFTSFSQAAQESADSRLYGGIHFRFDNEDGLEAGLSLGDYVASNFFQEADNEATAGLVDGVLVVFGTDDRDLIRVEQVRSQIVVMAGSRRLGTFSLSQVESITIDARGGNDLVHLGVDVRVDATILGGDGDDLLIGGRGNDVLLGGVGNDLLLGLFGDDELDGEEGVDLEIAGPRGQAPSELLARRWRG